MYRGYIGIVERKMETTIAYGGGISGVCMSELYGKRLEPRYKRVDLTPRTLSPKPPDKRLDHHFTSRSL